MTPISQADFILNPDGSIYHLKLQPGQLAETIITVGDPARVGAVSKYFDTLEVEVAHREFVTHTGTLQGKRLSVISTGIGTDNIDIVLNEADALFNLDFESRQVKPELKSLNFIRIGTSGAIQEDIAVDQFLISTHALGMDGLLGFYDEGFQKRIQNIQLSDSIAAHCEQNYLVLPNRPYLYDGSGELLAKVGEGMLRGITLTCPGFYAPQNRALRLKGKTQRFLEVFSTYQFGDFRLTNMEMETAGLYGLARLMGHRAISCNAILANRATGEFSEKPSETIDELIRWVLRKLGD